MPRAKTVSRKSTEASSAALQRLDQDLGDRLSPIRFVVKRRLTGAILLDVGGTFDRVDGVYLDERCKLAKVLYLNEAQLDAFGGVVDWIAARKAGEKRPIELVFWGGRGSGKTHLAVLVVWLIAVAFPGAACLLVSPANTRRDELEQIITDHVPSAWRRGWNEQALTWFLANGSSISYVGADDDDALKRGGFEVALLNEAQLMTSQAYANAVAGVRNRSGRPKGLLILAHNPPTKVKGEWTEDHLEKIEAGRVNGIAYELDPKKNASIDADVTDDIDAAIRSVRPDLADADALGIRRRLGDMATPAFRAWQGPDKAGIIGHVGEPPTPVFAIDGTQLSGWRDVTRRETAKKVDSDNGYPVVVCCDFQRRPGCVGVFWRIYERPDGVLVYYAFHAITAIDQEDDLCQQIDEYLVGIGLDVRQCLAICDSTGKHQNGAHSQLSKPSHAIFREWMFHVVAPRRVRSSDGKFLNANPLVEDSLAQFYDICTADRVLVSASLKMEIVVQSLRRCKTKKRGNTVTLDAAKPGYSHWVDCSRYMTWFFEPKRGLAAPLPDPSVAEALRTIKVLTSA